MFMFLTYSLHGDVYQTTSVGFCMVLFVYSQRLSNNLALVNKLAQWIGIDRVYVRSLLI